MIRFGHRIRERWQSLPSGLVVWSWVSQVAVEYTKFNLTLFWEWDICSSQSYTQTILLSQILFPLLCFCFLRLIGVQLAFRFFIFFFPVPQGSRVNFIYAQHPSFNLYIFIRKLIIDNPVLLSQHACSSRHKLYMWTQVEKLKKSSCCGFRLHGSRAFGFWNVSQSLIHEVFWGVICGYTKSNV